MKVFYFVYWHDDRFKDKVGGPIKVYELASNLVSLGHDVVLYMPGIGRPEEQTHAKIVRVPFWDLSLIRFATYQLSILFLSLWHALKSGAPDIIVVRIMWSFVPMLIGKILSVPVILEINDSPYRAHEQVANPVKKRLIQWIDRTSIRLSDYILPATDRIFGDLCSRERFPAGRMTVVPSGANTKLFQPLDRKRCLEDLNLDPGFIYVGFIGTLFRYQGIDTLIDCAPLVLKANRAVRFLIVGDGPVRTALEVRVATADLSEFFIFTGHVPYESVPVFCNAMDLCVAPFLKEAGDCSPVKVFDYLACGRPVIMADIAQSGKVFESSGAVLFFSPEDPARLAGAILKLAEDDQLRAEMGHQGRDFVVASCSRMQYSETIEKIMLSLIRKAK